MAATISIDVPKAELAAFCRQNFIRKLSFFGSVTRGDFGLESDVDVLVEFEPGHVPGLAFFGMQEELSELFGRQVDLNTPGCFRPPLRQRIEAQAKVVYGKAKRSRSPATHARLRPNGSKALQEPKAGRLGRRPAV